MAIKFLSGLVTEGSADAFAIATLPTATAGLNIGLQVRMIEVDVDVLPEVDAAIYLQIVRRTTTAVAHVTDRRLLWNYQVIRRLTTSGIIDQVSPIRTFYPKDFGLIIAEDPIYLVIDSDTTSSALSAYFRIYYDTVRLSDSEKNALLAESANA